MKILVVDDSIVFRSAIKAALSTLTGVDVVKSVSNGQLCIDALKEHADVDLITLDLEMPVMDGIKTIEEIRKFNRKVVIIVFSSLTHKGAEKTLQALHLGANDFVTKPESDSSGSSEEQYEKIRVDLLPRIQAFKTHDSPRIAKVLNTNLPASSNSGDEVILNPLVNPVCNIMPELIVIGASTGGPEALASVFKNIHKKINVPMLIVQHMPPIFTEKLAMMLNKLSPIEVREAKVGDTLSPGFCYIAPGDFHMKLDLGGKIILDQSDKVCFVRPSVDVLLNSIVQNYNKKVLFIMLTGMGEDGAVAARKLKDKNGNIFIQDRESSVVWGMPGATKRNVPESHVIKLDQIGTLIEMNG